MRENIGLFSGKRIYDGEWREGSLFVGDDGRCEICCGTPRIRITYGVRPETVGECTGLRDKNGKLIFENHIIRFGDRIGSIVYGEGCWCVRDFTTRNRPAIDIILCEFDVEIIGNIHDNPELLKEGADNE